MLPHEVVRQVNGSAAQPGARPHSRQIAPTSRANGRFTTNTGANVRIAFEEEKPMISKAQVLRDVTQSSTASTPPPVVRGMMARAASSSTPAAAPPLSPSSFAIGGSSSHSTTPISPSRPVAIRPHSHQTDRSNTPPRLLGKALINASNVLPDEIASKALLLQSGMPTARPVGSAAARPRSGPPADDQFHVSLEKTSPARQGRGGNYRSPSRAGASKPTAQPDDEVVLPGTALQRTVPDRSGFVPNVIDRSSSQNAPSGGGVLSQGRPLTPAATTMPVASPSKGVRALQHVAMSRTNDSAIPSLAMSNSVPTSPYAAGGQQTRTELSTQSDGRGVVSALDGSYGVGGGTVDLADVSMAQLLASYGVTSQDCVAGDGIGADYDGGFTVEELAQTEGVMANLKTMALNQRPPANTFTTLVAPKMGCNENVWIVCTACVGNQTRSVPVAGGSKGAHSAVASGNSPTKAGIAPPATSSSAAVAAKDTTSANGTSGLQYHIIIDLSEWPMIDHGPSIIIPAFHYKATVEDHNLDRCLQYHVESSNRTLFACNTPIVADSERGTLTLVPNPSACGSTTLSVYLEDAASVDGESLPMRSATHRVFLHTMRTENTSANPAANGDGTPHPPQSSQLPPESIGKIITPRQGAFAAVPIAAKTAVHCDPQTGATSFIPDAQAAGMPPANLHAPYVFPLPNLLEVREDSCLRDQLQGLLERTQAAEDAFEEASHGNGGGGATANLRSTTGRLDCAFPYSAVVAPCYDAIANHFELLTAMCPPSQWRAARRVSSSFADIDASIDERGLSKRLEELVVLSADSSTPAVEDEESHENEICALLERVATLRQIDNGAEGQTDAISALEQLAKRRAESLGLTVLADIGVKDVILQSRRVRPIAEEQAELTTKCELLVDSLLTASRCFSHYGGFSEALEAAETASKGAEKYLGKDSKAHLAALIAIGTAHGQRGDYVAASKAFESAVDISEMVNGSGSGTTALVVVLLGACYAMHGDVSTGISCLQRAQRAFTTVLTARTESGGNTNPMLVNDLKLRIGVIQAFITSWRLTLGELTNEADITTACHSHVAIIAAADEAKYQHESADDRSASCATAAFEDESLSPSARSVILALMHSIVGSLLLACRERKAVDHFEEAAVLVAKASEEHEEEESSQAAASSPGTNAASNAPASHLSTLKLFAAVANGSVVCARLTANDMFNEANGRAVESSLETIGSLVGERHPYYCRLVALLGQLTRFADETLATNVHVTLLRTREVVRSVMCVPSLDAATIAASCALTTLQQAEATVPSLSGPERTARLRLALNFANEAVDTISACDQLFGNTIATERCLEFVVEPMCMAVFSAAHEPLPTLVIARLEARIEAIRRTHGETSLRLMEPLLNLGVVNYLQGNYQNAHHYLSKSLKVADTINLIFLLGHLFKPAVHLTASQAQERNRVAGDRLQIHQSVQFATILFAIAGVYVAQGNAEDAQSTYLQAQAALELAHMQTTLATGVILASLAKFLYSEGHYGDAMAHAEKAHASLREFHVSIGSDSHNAYSVVPTAGKSILNKVEEISAIILERTRSKGYQLVKQFDGRHRFVVYL